jgi:hypothetical protein
MRHAPQFERMPTAQRLFGAGPRFQVSIALK